LYIFHGYVSELSGHFVLFFHTLFYFWILNRRKSFLCSHLSAAEVPRVSSGLCVVGWGVEGWKGNGYGLE